MEAGGPGDGRTSTVRLVASAITIGDTPNCSDVTAVGSLFVGNSSHCDKL